MWMSLIRPFTAHGCYAGISHIPTDTLLPLIQTAHRGTPTRLRKPYTSYAESYFKQNVCMFFWFNCFWYLLWVCGFMEYVMSVFIWLLLLSQLANVSRVSGGCWANCFVKYSRHGWVVWEITWGFPHTFIIVAWIVIIITTIIILLCSIKILNWKSLALQQTTIIITFAF